MKKIVLLILAVLSLSGCRALCTDYCKENPEIRTQRVEVPVPVDCPKPTVEPRKQLPSVLIPADEVNRDLKGCIANQSYLENRVKQLEDQLRVYQNQSKTEGE